MHLLRSTGRVLPDWHRSDVHCGHGFDHATVWGAEQAANAEGSSIRSLCSPGSTAIRLERYRHTRHDLQLSSGVRLLITYQVAYLAEYHNSEERTMRLAVTRMVSIR